MSSPSSIAGPRSACGRRYRKGRVGRKAFCESMARAGLGAQAHPGEAGERPRLRPAHCPGRGPGRGHGRRHGWRHGRGLRHAGGGERLAGGAPDGAGAHARTPDRAGRLARPGGSRSRAVRRPRARPRAILWSMSTATTPDRRGCARCARGWRATGSPAGSLPSTGQRRWRAPLSARPQGCPGRGHPAGGRAALGVCGAAAAGLRTERASAGAFDGRPMCCARPSTMPTTGRRWPAPAGRSAR